MILLISYGNSLRRDDGAGLILGQRLEEIWEDEGVLFKHLAVHQLMPELATDIAQTEVSAVVFVDARNVQVGESDARIRVQAVESDPASPSMGHYLDPATLVLYARLLYGRQPPAWLVTVPGVDFDHGEELSQTALVALAQAPAVVADLRARQRGMRNQDGVPAWRHGPENGR